MSLTSVNSYSTNIVVTQMKRVLVILLVFHFIFTLITKAQLVSGPFEYNTSIISESAINFSGGLKRGYTFYGLEQGSLTFNTDTAKFWKGGCFFVHVLNIHGLGPTQKFVGDLMYLSNIEAGDYLGLYEYWFSQEIGKLKLLFGQHDMNTEFAGTKYGENFINSSYGVVSNLLLNLHVSIYPVAAPCILTKYSFSNNLLLRVASYDGEPGNMETNKFNVHWHINSREGLMNLAEVQYSAIKYNQNGITTSRGIQMGTYKLGLFYHTAKFTSYQDTTKKVSGNYGMYFIADRMIVPKPSNPYEGLAAIFEIGVSSPQYNMIDYSIEGGIRYYGILPYRTKDFIGLAFTYAHLSSYFIKMYPNRASSECSIEFSYKFEFGKHYTIQPDFQYIIDPGAIKSVPYAFVGLIRIQLTL